MRYVLDHIVVFYMLNISYIEFVLEVIRMVTGLQITCNDPIPPGTEAGRDKSVRIVWRKLTRELRPHATGTSVWRY